METPIKNTRPIGFVRIEEKLWLDHSLAIKKSFADCMILDVKNDAASHSIDIVLINSHFAQVDSDLAVPRYLCKFFVNDDGSVTRSAMKSEVDS